MKIQRKQSRVDCPPTCVAVRANAKAAFDDVADGVQGGAELGAGNRDLVPRQNPPPPRAGGTDQSADQPTINPGGGSLKTLLGNQLHPNEMILLLKLGWRKWWVRCRCK